MTIVYIPAAAVDATLTVIVDVAPGAAMGVMAAGTKAAVTPVEGPVTAAFRVTGIAVPEMKVAVTVAVVVTVAAPRVTVALAGLTARL